MLFRSERKDGFPVSLHVSDYPVVPCCGIECFVQLANGRVAIVSPFAFRARVVHNKAEARGVTSGRRPLKHLQVAI
jgi:hypothetical protein